MARDHALVALILAAALVPGTSRAQVTDPQTKPVLIELRTVFDAAGPGRIERTFEGRKLFLGHALLSDSNIVAVLPEPRPNHLYLRIYSTADASERLYHATSRLIGQRIALLVEDRIWAEPPVVQSAIRALGVLAAVPASQEEVERLARLISERWPAPHLIDDGFP